MFTLKQVSYTTI